MVSCPSAAARTRYCHETVAPLQADSGHTVFPSCRVEESYTALSCFLICLSFVKVLQQGAQGSGGQAALQPVESAPASTEPAESDAMASVKVRLVPESAFPLLTSLPS